MLVARVLALALALVLGSAGAASAQLSSGSGLTAPGYPGNTLRIEPPGKLTASTVETVRLSGHAQWDPETFTTIPDYSLHLYAQDAAVDDTCAPWFSAQRQKAINLPGLSASASISGWVVDGDMSLSPEPNATTLDWTGETLPFSLRLGVRKVLLCAYQRFIIDDVASYALAVRVAQPRCRLAKRLVRRGGKLGIDCNVSGRLELSFRSGKSERTLTTRLSRKSGRGTVRTRSLRPGRYRVGFAVNRLELAGTSKLRVRR